MSLGRKALSASEPFPIQLLPPDPVVLENCFKISLSRPFSPILFFSSDLILPCPFFTLILPTFHFFHNGSRPQSNCCRRWM
ncbi:hypothetical protein BDV32DRAFT_2317 [Aspergillus pseudonomiae]|nr:hypothetical protein BDV32DRAFT_2317 [Aspergillus pseudonomiae]